MEFINRRKSKKLINRIVVSCDRNEVIVLRFFKDFFEKMLC